MKRYLVDEEECGGRFRVAATAIDYDVSEGDGKQQSIGLVLGRKGSPVRERRQPPRAPSGEIVVVLTAEIDALGL